MNRSFCLFLGISLFFLGCSAVQNAEQQRVTAQQTDAVAKDDVIPYCNTDVLMFQWQQLTTAAYQELSAKVSQHRANLKRVNCTDHVMCLEVQEFDQQAQASLDFTILVTALQRSILLKLDKKSCSLFVKNCTSKTPQKASECFEDTNEGMLTSFTETRDIWCCCDVLPNIQQQFYCYDALLYKLGEN